MTPGSPSSTGAPARGRAGVWRTLAVGLASVLVLLLLMPRAITIFDEGIILTGAMRVAHGDVVHRDFYSLYGPAQYYLVAAALQWFGNGFLAARLYDVLIRAAIVAALFAILRTRVRPAIALLATACCGAWLLTVFYPLYPVFPCLLLVLAGSALTARFGAGLASHRALFAAGLGTGAATLFRYDVGLLLLAAHMLALAAFAWLAPSRHRVQRFVVSALAYGIGTALLLLPAALAFLIVSPLQPFRTDIFQDGVRYYATMRALPFPGPRALLADPGRAAVYLPLLAALLAGAGLVRPAGAEATPRRAALITFGAATLLLFFKGVVRVSTIHMLLAIVPGLICLALVADAWWSRRRRLAAVAVLALLALLAFQPLLAFAQSNRWHPEASLGGWLAARAGWIAGAPELEPACATGPALGLALIGPDYARVSHYLAAHTSPDERILVGLARHDKVFVNPVALYFTTGRLPGTRWEQFDPGIQTRADVQRAMIDELRRNRVRFVVRDASFDAVQEPNGSALSSGVTLLDAYLDSEFRRVAGSGPVSVWLRRGEEPGGGPAGPCEAGP